MVEFAWTDVFGYVGTVLCISSFLFQMYKVHANRSANDVSWGFIVLQLSVNVLYTIYNAIIINVPLLINNGTLVILIGILCGQKYYFDYYVVDKEKIVVIDDIKEDGVREEVEVEIDLFE